MKKIELGISLFILLAGAFLAGFLFNQPATAGNTQTEGRKALYYVDPMHPAYKSDKPGAAPDCGMQLVPVYAENAGDMAALGDSGSAGTVSITPAQQQLFGVRVARVEKASGTQRLRLLGRVAPDETRVYKLNAALDGSIVDVSAATTGSQIRKNQWLATFFSTDSRAPIQAYLSALEVADRAAAATTDASQIKSAEASSHFAYERLKSTGMSPLQIEEVRRSRQIAVTTRILAPADGFLLSRNVTPGLKFERGVEWFRIADLRRVWILADVFGSDAQYLRPGMRAQVSLSNPPHTLSARVADVLPQFDPAARTLKVRLEADNPGFILRPDMFVDVELAVQSAPAITVPVDALIDSGLAKTVFVDRGNGYFEPRRVQTGGHFGSNVEIVAGLLPGETVVVSGTFLVDSESRLKAAEARMYAPIKDPACGMEVDQSKAGAAGNTVEFGGKTYFFCSDQCKRKFEQSPQKYADGLDQSEHHHIKT